MLRHTAGRTERPAARGSGAELAPGIAQDAPLNAMIRSGCAGGGSPPPLQPCAPATTGRPAVRGNKSTTWSAQRPDRTTCCAAGPGRWRQPAEARKWRGGRESSGSGWAALKSTGSRRRVHRSALAARATCRPTTGCRLAPAASAAAAVIARQHHHPQSFVWQPNLYQVRRMSLLGLHSSDSGHCTRVSKTH